MAEPPPRPPEDDDETVVVPPEETVVGDEWAIPPERQVTTVHETREEEVVPEPRRRPPLLWPALLALLVLVLAALALGWWLARDDEDEAPPATTAEQVAVPRLVGLTEERAREELEELGLEPNVTRRAAEGPEGVVLEQDPEQGELVDPGQEVDVVVSEGPETTTGQTTTGQTTTAAPQTVQVPEVVGQSSSDATATLRGAGFEVAIVSVPSDEPEGTVVAQNPSAGAEAERGSEVRLNVAEAPPEPAVVPDVVGQPAADAAQAFGDEGLRVSLRYVPSSEPAGNVVAQAQSPGTELQPGSSVQVNVSTGAEPAGAASVPDVGAQPLDEARETLANAGFEVLALNLSDQLQRTDTVARQTPAGGASIPGGSLVVLYVTR